VLEWFSGLTLGLMVFYGIAIFATFVLVVQVVLLIFGVGDDIDVVDLQDADGLGLLSLRSAIGFLGGFGWTGLIALENGLSLGVATALGVVVGGVLMVSVAYLMKTLYSLRESGTINYEAAIGEVGTVYLTIPPNQSGPGQVRVMVQGRLKVVPAFTESETQIPSERRVKVVGLLDPRTLMVEPLGKAESREENEQ